MRQWWSGLSGRRRGLLAAIVFVVIAGVVAGVFAAVVALVPGEDRPRAGTGPVLLVPGYGGSRGSLSTLAERIRRTGREATVLTLPGDGTGDLRAQVRVLDDAARDALDAGAPSVDVIGFSAGGVVARLWVEDGTAPVRRVVTLGSPLHGTRLATAGGVLAPDACPLACQQLSPGSALLAGIADPPEVAWLSLWTENDRTVRPPDSARLPARSTWRCRTSARTRWWRTANCRPTRSSRGWCFGRSARARSSRRSRATAPRCAPRVADVGSFFREGDQPSRGGKERPCDSRRSPGTGSSVPDCGQFARSERNSA